MSQRMSVTVRRALLLLAVAAVAGTHAQAQSFEERFEAARTATWSTATRDEGIAALRDLVRERPAAFGPRYELAHALTWSRETREEGVARLRALESEYPGNADVAESLARTLSWSKGTRDEAVDRLDRLVSRDPGRTSARLALAEVLSWRTETRAEAERHYREVLAREPESSEARIGLARVSSWRGDFGAARALTDEALASDPLNVDARIGLAQIDVWSGRPRAALDTLEPLDAAGAGEREAIKAAGESYEAIGHRTRALELYRRLLAGSPDDLWAQRRVERLTDRLRPRLSVGMYVSTESGDPATSKVEWARTPVLWSWIPTGDLELTVGAQLASFENDQGNTRRTSLGAALESPLGRHVTVDAAVWIHDFEVADGEVEGELEIGISPIDRVTVRLGARRRLLLSSRLSAVGESIGGLVYGPAVLDEVTGGASVKISRRWDASLSAGTGTVDGTRLAPNDRWWLYGDVGRRFTVRDATLTAKLLVYQLEHDLDLGGFPPADLGGDGVTARGVGGYFSPFEFRNQMVQLDATWSRGDRLDFFASGGLGLQQGLDAEDGDFGNTDVSSRALFVVSWRATDRLIVRGLAERQDVAAAFDRTRVGAELVILF